MSTNGRDQRGRFVGGNPGGPGRPRRPVEQEYLATLNGAVTLDAWRQIVDRAVEDARGGDAKAREWLAQYVIGDKPTSLVQLAADEQSGLTADASIASLAVEQRRVVWLTGLHRGMAELLSVQQRSVETADSVPSVSDRASNAE